MGRCSCGFFFKVSEIPVLAQPVRLGRQVAVDDIALLVLETPGGDDHDVAFPDPGALLDLSFDSSHACDAIVAPYPDMVGPHHEVSECELLTSPLLGQTNPDNRRSVRVYCVWIYIIIVIGSNSDNSFVICMTFCVNEGMYCINGGKRSHKTFLKFHFLTARSVPYILPQLLLSSCNDRQRCVSQTTDSLYTANEIGGG